MLYYCYLVHTLGQLCALHARSWGWVSSFRMTSHNRTSGIRARDDNRNGLGKIPRVIDTNSLLFRVWGRGLRMEKCAGNKYISAKVNAAYTVRTKPYHVYPKSSEYSSNGRRLTGTRHHRPQPAGFKYPMNLSPHIFVRFKTNTVHSRKDILSTRTTNEVTKGVGGYWNCRESSPFSPGSTEDCIELHPHNSSYSVLSYYIRMTSRTKDQPSHSFSTSPSSSSSPFSLAYTLRFQTRLSLLLQHLAQLLSSVKNPSCVCTTCCTGRILSVSL